MRLMVNVFKHGEGRSLDDLRKLYPEFLRERSHHWNVYDDTDMEVTNEHVAGFAAAIESFWRELPPTVTFDGDAALDVPDEIEKAWDKDFCIAAGVPREFLSPSDQTGRFRLCAVIRNCLIIPPSHLVLGERWRVNSYLPMLRGRHPIPE